MNNCLTIEDVDFIENKMAGFPKFLEENYGFSNSNAHEVKKRIRKIRDIFVNQMLLKDHETVEFSVVLASLINQSPLERSKIAQKLGAPVANFNRWFRGDLYPHDKNLKFVTKAEKYFKLPKGTLTKRLGNVLFGQKTELTKIKDRTKLGKKIQELSDIPYSLTRENWPDELEEEFLYISEFYLYEDLEDTVYEGLKKRSSMQWGSFDSPTGTYRQLERLFECFFGFLTLPENKKEKRLSGLNMKKTELSIFHITDFQLLKKFFLFSKARRGAWTTGIELMAKRVYALLNPKYGILTQSKKQGKVFLESLGKENIKWTKFCRKNRELIKDFLDEKEFKPLSDPFERVIDILDGDDPYIVIKKALMKGEEDLSLPGLADNNKSQRLRDHLIFFFHILFGFRCEHFSSLQIGKQLFKKNGLWHLCILRDDLKRRSIMQQERATIKIPEEVSLKIDEYIDNYRPMLKSENSDYLFVPAKNSNKNTTDKLTSKTISNIFKKYTLCYLDTRFGLSSHDTRKIIATVSHVVSCMENFQKGAMILLHDSKTNKEHYTTNEIKHAFKFHFLNLAEYGILERHREEQKISEYQILLNKNYELEKSLRELQKKLASKANHNHTGLQIV